MRECMADIAEAQGMQAASDYWSSLCPANWSSATPVLKSDPITCSPSLQVKQVLRLTMCSFVKPPTRIWEMSIFSLVTPPVCLWCPYWHPHTPPPPPTHPRGSGTRDLGKAYGQSAEGSWKCVQVYQERWLLKRDLVVEFGCWQCSRGKEEMLENLE